MTWIQWHSCRSKYRYLSRGEANVAIAHLRRRYGGLRGRAAHNGLRPYCCPFCKGWHLSSRRHWVCSGQEDFVESFDALKG